MVETWMCNQVFMVFVKQIPFRFAILKTRTWRTHSIFKLRPRRDGFILYAALLLQGLPHVLGTFGRNRVHAANDALNVAQPDQFLPVMEFELLSCGCFHFLFPQ